MDQRTLSALSHLSEDMIWFRYTIRCLTTMTKSYLLINKDTVYQTPKEKYIMLITENAVEVSRKIRKDTKLRLNHTSL
jgi:hypothetical protein